MARKDVDLVIRAKDEAAKVVDAITAALNEFIDAQSDLNKSAGKTSSTLGALGAAFGELNRELKGVSVSEKLASELDKATAAATRLQAEFDETQAAAQKLATELARAEAATERLRQKTEGAQSAQAKAAGILEKQKAAQKELTAALAEATKERDRLVRQEAALAQRMEKQAARVSETAARYDKLAAEIAAATGPTKTLESRLESVGASLAKQTTKLEQLRTEHEAAQKAIGETGLKIGEVSTKLDASNTAVARQETIVGKITENYKNLSVASKTAARNQNEIADAVDRTADVLDRQAARMGRAESELTQLASASARADQAFAELAAQSGAALQSALGSVRGELAKTRAELKQSSTDAKALAESMDIIGPPTRQQVVELGRLRAAAEAAEKSIIAQFTGLREMRAVLEQTGGSLEDLRNRQDRFVAIQREMAAALERIQAEAKETAAAYDKLAVATERTVQGQRQVGAAVRSGGQASAEAARSTNSLAEAYRKLYGESRQALSLTQRLRGEVLSLISAYGGIFGVISLLQRTVGAYQTLEAAQSRLNVAFDGNQAKAAQELDFIRRAADRLGIEFGSLADEYSKFAIATQGTSLQGEKTRKIFISVAEAARVNKLSYDQLKGVFTALTQIVSKGAVQMEELRQQLGDRLPGAIQLMADGLGVGTDELIKMMEQGQVSSDALIGFAEELDKKFGTQLAEALKSTTTAMGQFQNAAFQALVAFGQAGFIQSFTELLRDLTEVLQSADFQAFAARVSQGFGLLMDVLGLAAQNFDLLVIAASAFAGIKLTPFILAIGKAVGDMGGKFQRVGTIMVATKNVMAATTATTTGLAAATGVASTALRGMSLAIRALFSATGVGLAVTAISVAIGMWATRADQATEALARHRKIVDQAKNAYDEAGGAAKNWAEEVKKIGVAQATQNVTEMIKRLKDIRREAKTLIEFRTGGFDPTGSIRGLNELIRAFRTGGKDAQVFKKELDAIAAANPNLDKTIIAQLQDLADRAVEAGKDAQDARDVLTAITGTADEAAAAMKRLNGETDGTGEAMKDAAGGTQEYKDALQKIRDILPDINQGLDDLKTKAQIDEAAESARNAARGMHEYRTAIAEANAAYDRLTQHTMDQNFGRFTDGAEAAAALLRQREGFLGTAERDNGGAFRVGFGSDTITLDDGTIRRVTEGMRVSVAEANADLMRRIGIEMQGWRQAIGADRFGQLTAQQQAALTSLSYNYGTGELMPGGDLDGVVQAVRSGSSQGVADAIRALGGDNGGINRGRRNQEAALFTSTAGVEPAAQDAERERQRAEEERQRQREHTQETIAAQQFEISQQELINAGKAREAEIEKAVAEARKADPNIGEKELQQIRDQTGALFDLKKVRELDKTQQQEAEAMMQRVNALLQQRTVLEQQLKLAQQSGDTTKVAETQQAIANVNTQLDEAIAKAREMWNSIGGAAADTAMIKLDTAAAKAGNLAAKAQQNYIDWQRVGQLFASGLTNAFDNFAKAVAEGEDIGEAARQAFLQFASDFLRQIAQMIIQQAILNAMRSFGFGGGAGVGVAHTGGRVGSSRVGSGNSTRRVSPAIFANAMRLHSGGVPGLRPGEVPAILEQNEEVLTREDPRHVLNGGLAAAASASGSGAGDVNLRNVNVFNAEDMLERALRTRVGERVFLNWVRDNPDAIQAALGGKG